MRNSVRFDASKWQSQVDALESRLRGRLAKSTVDVREAVIVTAREAAQDLGDRTFPKGYGFKLAKAQMLHELSQLYATGSRVYQILKDAGEEPLARSFYHAYKSGNLSEAGAVLRRSRTKFSGIPVAHLDPALHDSSRSKQDGHITVIQPKQIVPEHELKAYQSVALKRLGKTASGWLACAEQLGGDGNKPAWKGTALHGSDGGRVDIVESDLGWHVKLVNLRPLAAKLLSPGQKRTIIRQAREKLKERLSRAVGKITGNSRAA